MLGNIIRPGGFARVASPKMISDYHMLRMNFCDTARQAQRHTETRKRVDMYNSVGYISFFLYFYFSLFIYLSLFLSPPPPLFPFPPSHTQRAEEKNTSLKM